MRIVAGGDWFWRCNVLATAIVRRLVARYGADIVIALGGGNGVDQSFAVACDTSRKVTEHLDHTALASKSPPIGDFALRTDDTKYP